MRHVLIVSPRFPPINAADHQRVRMAIPYLESFGWRATVLYVKPQFVGAGLDPLLEKSIPSEVNCVGTDAIPLKISKKFGIGSLTLRCRGRLARTGDRILANDPCDLVYFSTTEFGVMPLGRRWQQRFNVPYVLDIQDPWVNDHYKRTGQRPPGGKIKHGITQWFAARAEPATMRGAAHTTVVSEHYISNLIARYPDLSPDRFTTLPFAATPRDYELVAEENVVQDKFDPSDGLDHWVYIGRCGPDMKFSLTAMLLAFRNALQSGQPLEHVRMHFLGTDYANKDQARHWVSPIAKELGVAEYVTEVPDRVPYFQVLRCLQQASALIVPGSDDPRYTASKLYPYISAARPCLTVFHQDSSVNGIMSETKAGVAVTFDSGDSVESVAKRIEQDWFSAKQYSCVPETNWDAFAPYTAESMTRRLTQIFDAVVDESP